MGALWAEQVRVQAQKGLLYYDSPAIADATYKKKKKRQTTTNGRVGSNTPAGVVDAIRGSEKKNSRTKKSAKECWPKKKKKGKTLGGGVACGGGKKER